jgi:hypothetical protein
VGGVDSKAWKRPAWKTRAHVCVLFLAVPQACIRQAAPPAFALSAHMATKPCDDEAMVEAAKLLNAHARATEHEPLGRVLVRSKRAGRSMRPEQRGRAVELVIQSASKRSRTRCGPAARAASASLPFFPCPRCRDCSFVCAQFLAPCRRRRGSKSRMRSPGRHPHVCVKVSKCWPRPGPPLSKCQNFGRGRAPPVSKCQNFGRGRAPLCQSVKMLAAAGPPCVKSPKKRSLLVSMFLAGRCVSKL